MSPLFILVLVVIAVVAAVYLFGLKPDPARGRRPAPGILRRRSRWRRILPVVPLVAAVGCLVLAFTGFRFNVEETAPTILLVMDVSDSMEETDVAPNRLAAARSAALAFLDRVPSDFRVGLVTFAGDAELAVAPTRGQDEVVVALEGLTTSRGTKIGDGLTTALDAIDEVRRGDQDVPAAALLLSDGRDTGSLVPPDEAARRARTLDVPVYTVVVGQVAVGEGGGPDQAALEAIADTSGGEAFTAESAGELTAVYENLGSRLSVDLEVQPLTTPLVIAAIGLTLFAGIMLVFTPR
jgi:Ca-activated chloride channel family protein